MNTQPIPNPLILKLRGTAHNIARRYGADPDDIEQDLVLIILEAYTTDPEFLSQPDQAIINYAANRAGWQARKEATRPLTPSYRQALAQEPTTANPWPAVARRLDIEAALATLAPRDRRIATALAQGYTPREIADALSCSFKTVYNRKPVIAAALAGVVQPVTQSGGHVPI